MESAIVLNAEDIKKIISVFLGVPKENVIKSQYSYTVKGITGEQAGRIRLLALPYTDMEDNELSKPFKTIEELIESLESEDLEDDD